MPVELTIPDVGESISEVFIGTWLKAEGDAVKKDEPLVEVETDKATLEVPAPQSGTLSRILKRQGESANVGDVIAQISEDGELEAKERPAQAQDAPTEAPAAAAAPTETAAETRAAPDDQPSQETHAMPAARRLLDQHGLGPQDVDGTGKGGRILKEDVERHVSAARQPPAPTPQVAPGGSEEAEKREAPPATTAAREEEAVPMSPLRRSIAKRLVQAQQSAALLTTFNEVDMSGVIALRKQYQDDFVKRYEIKLGFMSFFVKAGIDALRRFPQLNAFVADNHIIYHNYYDIGIAVSAPKGLVVPVIRDAQQLSVAETEQAIADFGERSMANRLAPDELQGGTFTISNGGIFGSLLSTPIVNPPQSGVLGMHAIQERPVAVAGKVEIKPMMYLALTYDHRIVDGREAVTFLRRIKETIESPARILLEV